jgi:hypothetical protein
VASKLEARVSAHDREIAAIRKLILQGMRMIGRIEAGLLRLEGLQEVTRNDLRELAASQRKTDAQLQSLMRSLERGRNGHSKPS